MANTVLTIAGGEEAAGYDVEVYLDIDAKAKEDLSIAPSKCLVGDMIDMAVPALSAFALSGYAKNEHDEEIEVGTDTTALEWLNFPEISGAVYDQALLDFDRNSAYARIDGLMRILSAGPDQWMKSENTGSSITTDTITGISAVFENAMEHTFAGIDVATQPWRHRVQKLVNVNAVRNSIKQIFTWTPGERVINPEFGSRLRKYLYEQITDENQEKIVAEIKACVLQWEPRVVVNRVVNATSVDDVENNTVKLDIYYAIKGLDG